VSGSVRIVGGALAGRRLEVARATRPSSARLRAALASIWSEWIPGARVLDLYAGSGAVGLELLSRGAARAQFVEADRAAAAALAKNLALVEAGRAARLALDAGRALARLAAAGERFDLLFVDPPYELEPPVALCAALAAVAAPGARLALERRARRPLAVPEPWRPEASRRYGDARLDLFALEPAAPGSSREESGPRG
jgi:16S rRNA (guanine966-N2)-methyltransferase